MAFADSLYLWRTFPLFHKALFGEYEFIVYITRSVIVDAVANEVDYHLWRERNQPFREYARVGRFCVFEYVLPARERY